MTHKAPKHRRRQSTGGAGANRVDVVKSARNRVQLKTSKAGNRILSVTSIDNDGHSSALTDTVPDDVIGDLPDFSEHTGQVVLLAKRKLPARLQIGDTHRIQKTVKHLAGIHDCELAPAECDTPGAQAWEVLGIPDDVRNLAAHIAGHVDTPGALWSFPEQARESTGGTGHLLAGTMPVIETGHVDSKLRRAGDRAAKPGKRIDYSAGRNQPKATYSADGTYERECIDRPDARNDGIRGDIYAPKTPHTIHHD